VPRPPGPDILPVSPSRSPRLSVDPASLPLVGVAVVALFTSGLLRSFHASTPRLPLLPPPCDSLLFAATVLAGLATIRARRDGKDLFPPLSGRRHLTIDQVLPLVFVLFLEKWITGPVLEPILDRLVAPLPDPRLADAAWRGLGALGLLAAAFAGAYVLRGAWPRIRSVMQPRRIPVAAVLLATGAGGAAVVVAGAGLLARARIGWLPRPAGLLAAVIASQVVRAVAEETWYRGVIQVTVVRLLQGAGFREGRGVRVAGILLVAGAFTLEHVDPSRPLPAQAGELVFVLSMGVLFGTLLEASRNLWLVGGVHALVNLVVALAFPLPITPEGIPVLAPGVLATLLVVLVFVGVVVDHRRRGFA